MTMDQEDAPPVARQLLSSPSLACDLSWLLSAAASPPAQHKDPRFAQVFAGREELSERVRTFWADGMSDTYFTEMLALAHHAGAFNETSPTALWAALSEAAATVPTDLGLESETAEDRAFILDRLAQLKASPDLVRSYIALLREVWEPNDEVWQANLPLVGEYGLSLVAQIERGRPLPEILESECQIFRDKLPDIHERLDAGQPLMVVPCYFFGKSLYLEFPGLTVIGSGFHNGERGARARTEGLARRLKTVADPTRLALLHVLALSPSTVGDLAASFGLAQPTVSMHIKSLRETGLVRAERQGGRLQLSADPAAVETLLGDLRRVVVHGAGTTGSERNPTTVAGATHSNVPVMA
jgi:DNA-binding transcriptional ArsR family regulator